MTGEGRGVRALLHVDMVDSTVLLEQQGVQSQIEARKALDRVIAGAAAGCRGVVIDTRGDGALIEFVSAVDAVIAAGRMQRDAATAASFELRAGIAVGGGDEASTRARTIEAQCPPTAIAVDDMVLQAMHERGGATAFDGIVEPLPGGVNVVAASNETLESCLLGERTELAVVMFTDSGVAAAVDLGAQAIESHGGAIVDTNGNGHVGLFADATTALAAATAAHAAAASHNLRADVTERVQIGIGVSVGEIAVVDDGCFGRPVVEAARLLAIAQPGCTVASADVRRVADSHTGRSLGALELKGLERHVEAVEFGDVAASALVPLPTQFARRHRFGFAGRRDHLSALRALWGDSLDGDLRASVVIGEEGAGKTRLVEEFAREAHADGAIVLLGRCVEDLAQPFQAMAEALKGLAEVDAALAQAVEYGDGVLAAMFGNVESSSASTHPVSRFELFAAVSDVLHRVSSIRPVVLVVDDVQWASSDTLQMLESLITEIESSRVMIVATCRGESLDGSHPVEQLLLGATRTGHRVDRRRVERLGDDDVVAMLESRTGRPLDDNETAFALKVADVTGGSPLYAEELVTHLANTGVLNDGAAGWELTVSTDALPIPESVTALMGARLQRLGDDAVEVLSVAALIGASFDIDVLATVLERPISDVLDVVEAAGTARLVFEGDAGEPCAFSDEIVREALLAHVRPGRRGLLHRSIAEALEAEQPHQIDQLALHWDRVPGASAKQRAIEVLRQVADRDTRAAAWESAVDRLRRVVDIQQELNIDDPAELGEVRFALGSALRTLGVAEHREVLIDAGMLARRARDGKLLGQAAGAMMRPGAWFPEAGVIDHEIIEMCEDSLLLLDAASPMRPRVLAVLATNLAFHPDVDRRRAVLAEAQELAREHGDLQLIGSTLVAEVLTEREPHRFERRVQIAAELRKIGRIVGDRDQAFVGGVFTLLEMYAQGRLDEADQLRDELETSAETSRAYWHCFVMSHFRTASAIFRCEPDAQQLVDAERDRFQHHDVDWFGVWTIQTASIALANGTLSQVLLSLDDVINATDDDDWGQKWNYAVAKAHMETGDFEAAVAAIEVNWDPVEDDYWLVSVQNLGLLGLEMGRRDWCELTLERLMPYRGRLGIIGLCAAIGAQISTSLGQAALGLSDCALAEELFRESVAQAEEVRAPFFATNARRYLARALLAQDPMSAEAVALLELNQRLSSELGFALEEAEATALLSMIGTNVGDPEALRGS